MAEAVISRASSGGGSIDPVVLSGVLPKNFIFTTNGNFVAPVTGEYFVMCVGGGGGGASTNDYSRIKSGGGGGSGYVNMGSYILNSGDSIPVTVGKGGIGQQNRTAYCYGNAGGTSSFGTYVSAIGGNGGETAGFYWYESGYQSVANPGSGFHKGNGYGSSNTTAEGYYMGGNGVLPPSILDARSFGRGGDGGNATGGNGADGCVYITWNYDEIIYVGQS